MTAKEFVKSVYPISKSEKFYYNKSKVNRSFIVIWNGENRIGFGETSLEAWKDARRNILKVKKIN